MFYFCFLEDETFFGCVNDNFIVRVSQCRFDAISVEAQEKEPRNLHFGLQVAQPRHPLVLSHHSRFRKVNLSQQVAAVQCSTLIQRQRVARNGLQSDLFPVKPSGWVRTVGGSAASWRASFSHVRVQWALPRSSDEICPHALFWVVCFGPKGLPSTPIEHVSECKNSPELPPGCMKEQTFCENV